MLQLLSGDEEHPFLPVNAFCLCWLCPPKEGSCVSSLGYRFVFACATVVFLLTHKYVTMLQSSTKVVHQVV